MESKKQSAFVWLLMLGDKYLAGALVSAFSFRKTSTKCDLVAMVTSDVSDFARKQLRKVFDDVVEVPYISVKSKPLRTQKQIETYPWIENSYTKWNCLKLINYQKVCMIDADFITLRNIDNLFELSAPAGIFVSPYTKLYNPYGDVEHGKTIGTQKIWKGLTRSFVPSAYLMVLPTSLKYHSGLMDMVNKFSPYGFPKCFYGHDEQSISHYMSCHKEGPKLNWSVIDPRYGFIIGKYQMLKKDQVPYGMHYINHPKPWVSNEEWSDLDIWWTLAQELSENHTIDWKNVDILVEKLSEDRSKICYFCKTFIKGGFDHHFIKCESLLKN